MDSFEDSQATQQATQNAVDPRRFGKQNSGFSDDDISDIICMLYPNSEGAEREVHRLASHPDYSRHTVGKYTADAIESDQYKEDDARDFDSRRGLGDHAIVLRLSSAVKNPSMGFTFGRNQTRCDIHFAHDPARRLSNIHFRIFVNEHGCLMLEDQSTNGTVVDEFLLKRPDAKRPDARRAHKRILESGSRIKIIMHSSMDDLLFFVRVPRRDGDLEAAYLRKLIRYRRRLAGLGEDEDDEDEDDPNRTIGPGPGGHVHLFPSPRKRKSVEMPQSVVATSALPLQMPREWRGGDKYARVCVIGKGAFATVYKVTSKYDGAPYAAKELDKRKFMKNGILDQKVENEMKIMQKVHHPNVVNYIEHFDWDAHQFIIVMEFVPGGDLGKLIMDRGPIGEPYVKIMATQLIDALGYLHENKITHRDVKPDNILIQSLDPFEVKLTDFGLSKMIDTEQTFLKTFCGTLLYCAPEVYNEYGSYDDNGRRTHRNNRRTVDRERYDHAVDIWSLGGVLFYTMTGNPPFPVKNGTSYTELLDHIMKTPVNVSPLSKAEVSMTGINFLSRMIHVRPETRATIAELQSHPWLRGDAESFDEISDDELGQSASQLSLVDRQPHLFDHGMTSLREPRLSEIMDYESEKENYTFDEASQGPGRLFGEVNNSAIGSSGVIPENCLNLPVSRSSFGETAILKAEGSNDMENKDLSDDFSTPRQTQPKTDCSQVPPTTSQRPADEHSAAEGQVVASQSLGGTSSIFGNLNMTSESHRGFSMGEFNVSKRKPAYDTSDEFESKNTSVKPSFKRLKSADDEINPGPDDGDEEYALLASVPPLNQNTSGRQIDFPLHKSTFWDGSNKETWHLNYPEMTHLQYSAFESAAVKRGEEFGPNKTSLWGLAMKYFPPMPEQERLRMAHLSQQSRAGGLVRDGSPTMDTDRWESGVAEGDVVSIPDTLPADGDMEPMSKSVLQAKTVVARLESSSGSLVSGISVALGDPILSWGRDRANTAVYEYVMESKVPKNAFRILLWRDGYNASFSEFRPWQPARSTSSRTMRASPEPESFSFYIATKATSGLRINSNPLQPNEPKHTMAPCKYWMKLHHGDTIVFWGSEDVNRQAKVTFECYWGGSSIPRPADEPPTCVPEPVARKLDRLWPKAVTTLRHDKNKMDVTREHEIRLQHMVREQERSRVFERKRSEAARYIASRTSRRTSPASAPPDSKRGLHQLRESPPAAIHSSE